MAPAISADGRVVTFLSNSRLDRDAALLHVNAPHAFISRVTSPRPTRQLDSIDPQVAIDRDGSCIAPTTYQPGSAADLNGGSDVNTACQS